MCVMHVYMLLLLENVQLQKYIKGIICKDSYVVSFMNPNPER